VNTTSHNGPCPDGFEAFKGTWLIRTDRLDRLTHEPDHIKFASVGGPVQLFGLKEGGQFLVLGSVQANTINTAFVACDGGISSPRGTQVARGIVVCRGNVVARDVGASVLLVDGDVDLTGAKALRDCLIRATGEIRLPKGGIPKDERPPAACTIEAHAKDATAPYKFFELADVGLSMTAGKEGLVVTAVKPDTPFGNCGLAKDDLVRAIDDTPAGSAEEFRKLIRRALVRQGDCLVTVVRGDKTIDLPVFFPLPK
jgi:S1-C subfamily serine protease